MGSTWRGRDYHQAVGRRRAMANTKPAPPPADRKRQGLTDTEWAVRAAAWSAAHGMPALLWLGPWMDPKPEPAAPAEASA